jgi:methionyl-tRNA formyltransferase
MDKEPRIVLLTGNGLRHRFAATSLSRTMNLLGIVSEGKAPLPTTSEQLNETDRSIVQKHFAERDSVEKKFLGARVDFPDTRVLEIEHNTVNALNVFEWVHEQVPDTVLLYGTSIVKPPLLEVYEGRVINLHLGLSPYYRGSGTNFWPLVNREPECVGATIHLAVFKVDAGAILAQVRPEPEKSDRAHELGTKTIIAGFDIMPLVVAGFLEGRIHPQPQDLSKGCVYRRKDFTAEATRRMWHNFETGMMRQYLSRLDQRLKEYPIVELPSKSIG